MSTWNNLDKLDMLLVDEAFLFQIIFFVHYRGET